MNDGGALEVRLGKRVQDFRKKAGFTQQELCHKAKLSYSTLAKIERGPLNRLLYLQCNLLHSP